MESDTPSYELAFEEVCESGLITRRIGRSKLTGLVLMESKLDAQGREIERMYFSDGGQLSQRVTYEYDQARKPKLISVFDKDGKLVWRYERGTRPDPWPTN